MSKTFRDWSLDQALLLPPSVHDFVAPGHLSRFIVALVTEELNLSAILASYRGERGQPPYHPAMMVALLLYAYAVGVYSSRRIAKACAERVDFMAIVALDAPDFRTISEFRRRHLTALSALFMQVLKLCEQAGLVKLGHVALDGTKIKANASKHKAMSYERMSKREVEIEAEVAGWLAAAEAADAEAEKAARENEAADDPRPGRKAAPPSDVPEGKAQRNFTDPESRIMKTKDGFIQGYNAQAAVDAAGQVIVAHGLSNASNDQQQLAPMLDAIEANMGELPDELSADAGYCSEANLERLEQKRVSGYVATGRQKHGAAAATGERAYRTASRLAAMATKLRRAGRRSRYRLRKQVVEPVFGQIKQARGFRQFLMRGIEKVTAEWA